MKMDKVRTDNTQDVIVLAQSVDKQTQNDSSSIRKKDKKKEGIRGRDEGSLLHTEYELRPD